MMRVTLLQMNPGADKQANIDQATRLLNDAVPDAPDLVSLPEMWTCLGGDLATKRQAAERLPEPGGTGGLAYEFLRQVARSQGVTVHGGSICEDGGERLYNTTVVFGPDGTERARYRKIHLFDITTPDGQGYRESASYGAGDRVVTIDVGGVRLGLAICYDLRFAELFLALRRAGAEVVMLPSAFTVPTGRDHWEPLLRARAIETQCWVLAAATWGQHRDGGGGTRQTYGHSMIIDPWGAVVAMAPDGVGVVSARIDPARTARVRRDMPVMDHRKLESGQLA